jgi:A/G-specific adenine glycosylase
MPAKKKTSTTPAVALPPPNTLHPCAALLPSVLSPSSLSSGSRPHPASYHSFLSSPFFPTPSTSSSNRTEEPPSKKRKTSSKVEQPKLPPLLETASDVEETQKRLLEWYDSVKEGRGMPWRKEVKVEQLSREERSQRGYEVRLPFSLLLEDDLSMMTCAGEPGGSRSRAN